MHTSVRNLEYLFKRYMNMTVKDYMISVKISSAAALLRMNAKVSETADKLCFEDVSTFTRLFKSTWESRRSSISSSVIPTKRIRDGLLRNNSPEKSEEKE